MAGMLADENVQRSILKWSWRLVAGLAIFVVVLEGVLEWRYRTAKPVWISPDLAQVYGQDEWTLKVIEAVYEVKAGVPRGDFRHIRKAFSSEGWVDIGSAVRANATEKQKARWRTCAVRELSPPEIIQVFNQGHVLESKGAIKQDCVSAATGEASNVVIDYKIKVEPLAKLPQLAEPSAFLATVERSC